MMVKIKIEKHEDQREGTWYTLEVEGGEKKQINSLRDLMAYLKGLLFDLFVE
jgi:adenosyl cobinamide kinase/adenosyl cobinamide phosphate guanylyltransferase